MKSLRGFHWEMAPEHPSAVSLAAALGIPEVVARILCARGIAPEEAPAFLKPTLRHFLPDPFHLRDMEKAAARVADAIEHDETIGIFGDYDVDGATSTALLLRYVRALGREAIYYIPDRIKEGYGPNAPALRKLKEQGASLVLTVDCGTLAFDALAEVKELDIIVIDHHQADAALPQCFAVINPNRVDQESECCHLAAVGVAFLLMVAVTKLLRARGWFTNAPEPNLMQWLDLVALGTVCDVMPLSGLNRAFVAQGLQLVARRSNAGLAALMDHAHLQEKAGCYHLGFILGPRINAGGRVGAPEMGARLLSTDDSLDAAKIATQLGQWNEERKTLEQLATEEAMRHCAGREDPVLVVAHAGFHHGIIGIVAGRLKETFHRPAVVIAVEDGKGKGSARSIMGFDIGAAIANAKAKGLIAAGGGHAAAAGFSLDESQIPAFAEFLSQEAQSRVAEYLETRSMTVDAQLSLQALTVELVQHLETLGPFGAGNKEPRLMIPSCRILHHQLVGNGGHLRCVIVDGSTEGSASGTRQKAMLFRAEGTELGAALQQSGARWHLLGYARKNSWQGRESVDFIIEDAMRLNGAA